MGEGEPQYRLYDVICYIITNYKEEVEAVVGVCEEDPEMEGIQLQDEFQIEDKRKEDLQSLA